jgi:asparagine N-glycosylation enzyme membrane subunit Stt3
MSYSAKSEPPHAGSGQTFRSRPASYFLSHLVQERCDRKENGTLRPYHRGVAAAKRRKPRAGPVAGRATPASTPASGPSRTIYFGNLAAASLVVALLALHRHATVMLEPGGRFEDPDAMFHAHRVVRTIAEGKLLPPVFDPFENFPEGGRALWPPLHDATLALLARLGGSTAADPRRGLPLAAALPVAELVLGVLAASALAKRAGGFRGGAAAAWLFALTPCLSRRGAFGEIDHNLTEILAALLLLLAADTIARREESAGRGLHDSRLSSLLWAAAVLIALGLYTGLILSMGIAAAAVAARDLATPGARALPRISLGFALAALALPFFASLRATPEGGDSWRLGPVYVLILAMGAVGTGLLALAAALRRGLSPNPDLFSAAGALAGAAVMLATSARAWPALAQGFGFLGSRDPWLATIAEFQPLFSNRIWAAAALPAVPVAIVALLLVTVIWRKENRTTPPDVLFLAVPFVVLALLTLVQSRFLPMTAALAAPAGGAVWSLLSRRPGARAALWGVALLGMVPASTGYLIPFLGATIRGTEAPVVLAWEATSEAIRARTPDPGHPPAWGILAPWDFGHAIVYRASRAVALNNFGSMQPGFAAAQKLWLEPSPVKAARELSRLRLRYVLVVWPPYFVPSAAASLGLDTRSYFEGKWSPERPVAYRPTPAGTRTLSVRLHLRNAEPLPDDGPDDRAALSRFRLIWSSEEADRGPEGPLPLQKLFELTAHEGATASR